MENIISIHQEKWFQNFKRFFSSTIIKKNCLIRPWKLCTGLANQRKRFIRGRPPRNNNCLLTDRNKMNNLYRGPSIYVSQGVSVHFFRNGLIRKKELPVATMFANGSGRNEISSQRTFQQTLPTKFLFIWKSGLRVEIFRNQAFRKKNSMCRACFLTNRSEISILYRGPSIYASY